MLDFGWKKKAERLRMTLLSAGHQMAKDLHPSIQITLDLFREAAKSGDGSHLQDDLAHLKEVTDLDDVARPLWEPADIYGWHIQATFYLLNHQLWWLLRAVRSNEQSPTEKDIAFLDKVLGHLGADPRRDMIIGPGSSPAGHQPLPFGWWTWFNRMPLFEIQVNKNKKDKDMMRVVSLGAAESEGYVSVDLTAKADRPTGA